MHERLHHRDIVVHVSEQHRLIAQGNASVGQTAQRLAHLGGQFAGMVGVDADEEGVVFPEHRAQFRGDALG